MQCRVSSRSLRLLILPVSSLFQEDGAVCGQPGVVGGRRLEGVRRGKEGSHICHHSGPPVVGDGEPAKGFTEGDAGVLAVGGKLGQSGGKFIGAGGGPAEVGVPPLCVARSPCRDVEALETAALVAPERGGSRER